MVANDHAISVTDDAAQMDFDAIHDFLCNESYWATGIPVVTLRRAMENSLCFAVLDGAQTVGFARVVTDRATFAYLCDVYVLASHRGRGLAKRLMQAIDSHPDLQGLRRWNLVTRDAHALYAQFGFVAPANPAGYMERRNPDVYLTSNVQKASAKPTGDVRG
jgi:GNAT superfamily N-acetyltransferase